MLISHLYVCDIYMLDIHHDHTITRFICSTKLAIISMFGIVITITTISNNNGKIPVCFIAAHDLSSHVQSLRPGGVLLLRDYGSGDSRHNEFEELRDRRKLGERFFARPDGTRVYFFDADEVAQLARDCGFSVERCDTEQHTVVNRKVLGKELLHLHTHLLTHAHGL